MTRQERKPTWREGVEDAIELNAMLPNDKRLEETIIGEMLASETARSNSLSKLDSGDFYSDETRFIFQAIRQCFVAHGDQVDYVTVSTELKNMGKLDEAGGTYNLMKLEAEAIGPYVAGTANKSHVNQLVEVTHLREIVLTAVQAAKDCYMTFSDSKKISNEMIDRLLNLQSEKSKGWQKMGSLVTTNVLATEKAIIDGTLPGTPTGFHVFDKILGGLKPRYYIIGARPSQGKAQPLDAKVLTVNGWKIMGEIKVGDELASTDGNLSTVIGITPHAEKQIFKVKFADGRSTECCGEHLWQVHFRKWPKPRILSTAEVMGMLKRKRYQKRLWIDTIKGDFGHDEQLPIKPWILGVLLGDGDLNSTCRFTTKSKFILERMRKEVGEEFRITTSDNLQYRIIQAENHRRPGRNTVWPNPLMEKLKKLGLWKKHSYDKFIPDIYKTASYDSRLELLRGLLDTDGWVEWYHSIKISVSNERLANDIVDLARSLGAWVTKRTKPSHYTKNGKRTKARDSFVVAIVHPNPKSLLTLPFKKRRALCKMKNMKRLTFTSIEPTRQVDARCITVSHPTGLYVTDDYIVTHNSALGAGILKNIVEITGKPVGIFSLEMGDELLSNREIAHYGKVNLTNWITHDIDRADIGLIKERLKLRDEELKKIYVDTTPGLTVIEMYSKMRQLLMLEPDLAAFVIDYIQLMSTGMKKKFDNRQMEISFISERIQQIVKIINLPVIVVSQLSREVEKRRGKRPQLSDLRESGALEMHADIIMLLFRRSFYYKTFVQKMAENGQRVDVTEVEIAKNKEGATGYLELGWDGPHTRFLNLKENSEEIRFTKRTKKQREAEEDDDQVGREIQQGDGKLYTTHDGKPSDSPF